MTRAGSRLPFQKGDDFSRPGVSLQLGLLENRDPVAQHLEPAASRRNQLDLDRRKPVPELSRQTGGSGLVVSKSAVLDRDVHDDLPGIDDPMMVSLN